MVHLKFLNSINFNSILGDNMKILQFVLIQFDISNVIIYFYNNINLIMFLTIIILKFSML